MQLIEGGEQFRGWKTDGRVPGNLRTIFDSLRLEAKLLEAQRDIVYQVIFRYARMQEVQLTTIWHFRLCEQLEITVEMDDVHKALGGTVQQGQLANYLQELNRRSDGTFYSKCQNSQLLGFRHKLGYRSQYNYLQVHISNIVKTLYNQFLCYSIKLKILPNIGQSMQDKMHKITNHLNYIKEAIELNRQKRSLTCSFKTIAEAFLLIGTSLGKLKEYKKDVPNLQKNVTKHYLSLENKVKAHLAEELKRTKREIVWGLEIKRTLVERQHSKAGGYSIIYAGKYLAEAVPTSVTAASLSQQLLDYTKKGCWDLAKKVKKPRGANQKEDFSFQNQQSFLKFIRGQKNNRIAEYFLRLIGGLYLQIYPRNLYELYSAEAVSINRLINISVQILEGITFLWNNSILHRDLKEHNIMIDLNGEPKIIDFGSSCGFFTNSTTQYQPFNTELMSTKGYYLPYSEVKSAKIIENYSRDQYNRSSTFDVYSFGQILINMFKLNIQHESLTYLQLVYLARKCQQINPADRPTPFQLLAFMRDLRILCNEETNAMKDEKMLLSRKNKPEAG